MCCWDTEPNSNKYPSPVARRHPWDGDGLPTNSRKLKAGALLIAFGAPTVRFPLNFASPNFFRKMFPNACSNITTLASRRDNPLSRESTLYSEVVQRRDEPDAPGNCEKGELRAETRPTEDELRRLRRVPGRIPWSACTITIIELFERFSFNGTFVVCTYVPC